MVSPVPVPFLVVNEKAIVNELPIHNVKDDQGGFRYILPLMTGFGVIVRLVIVASPSSFIAHALSNSQ